MIVVGVDPGPAQSAYVAFDGRAVVDHAIVSNEELLSILQFEEWAPEQVVVFETVESFGMTVGLDVFETVFETGRMFQMVDDGERARMQRREVKRHLCKSMRAKDANIRQALINRFGGSKQAAQGVKKNPGPLYGIRTHEWSALAIAVTWWDRHVEGSGDGGK